MCLIITMFLWLLLPDLSQVFTAFNNPPHGLVYSFS